jgi:hypothetical protein
MVNSFVKLPWWWHDGNDEAGEVFFNKRAIQCQAYHLRLPPPARGKSGGPSSTKGSGEESRAARLQQKADLDKTLQGGSKKQKVWGPVQAVRQSSRIDRSKHILEKAMELKEKKNAMPSSKIMSGIIHSNPFHVLQNSEFVDMSSKLGVVINIEDDDTPSVGDSCISIDCQSPEIDKITLNQSISIEQIIKTPEHYNTVLESDDEEDNLWIDVYRKKRGKHPRKLFK